jgi:hypothetical protein
MYPDGEPAEKEDPPRPSILKSAILRFRVAELLFSAASGDGEMAQTQVLLFGAAGTAKGEVLAERKGDRFYISGITVDFADLFLPKKDKDGEVFDPGPSAGPAF